MLNTGTLLYLSSREPGWTPVGWENTHTPTHTSHNTSLVFPELSLPNCPTENSSQCVIGTSCCSSTPGTLVHIRSHLHRKRTETSLQLTSAAVLKQTDGAKRQTDSSTLAPSHSKMPKRLPNSTSSCWTCFWRKCSGFLWKQVRTFLKENSGYKWMLITGCF